MKRIRTIVAACLVYVLFIFVFGLIAKNNDNSSESNYQQPLEKISNGANEPNPDPPPPKP